MVWGIFGSMMDQQKISIGRVRQAYRLNAQDAGILIAALERVNCLHLYELWHEAVRFVAIEDHNKKSLFDEVTEPYFPDTSDLGQGPLEGRILAKRLLKHFLFAARAEKPRDQLQRIFDRVLHFTYDDPDEQQALSVNHILDMIYKQRVFGFHGKDKVDLSWVSVSPELFAEFCSLFDDAISVNKEGAVLWLFEQGYSQVRSVKGLSMELARRIVAAAATAQAQAAPEILPFSTPPETAIFIPRSLWEGKTRRAVREAMRKEEFSDAVIAHILLTRCDAPKTEIASLLDTNTKRIRALLAEAAAMHIEDS